MMFCRVGLSYQGHCHCCKCKLSPCLRWRLLPRSHSGSYYLPLLRIRLQLADGQGAAGVAILVSLPFAMKSPLLEVLLVPRKSHNTRPRLAFASTLAFLIPFYQLLGSNTPSRFLAVIAIAMSSASLSALILGSFMCSIILLCRRYRLNPGEYPILAAPFPVLIMNSV